MGEQFPLQSPTLHEAALRLQELPLLDLAPAGLLAIVGLLLLFYGQKLLKPSLVCAAIIIGAWVAGPFVGMLSPPIASKVPSLLWPILGGIAGLVLIALSWRLLVALTFGIVLAAVFVVGSRALVEAGFIDAQASPSAALVAEDASSTLLSDALVKSAAKLDGVGPAVERVHTAVRPLILWINARWEAEPPQMRTLFLATSATGMFMGVLLGLFLAKDIAALLTAVVGALFLLVGGLPLAERYSTSFAEPMHPFTWMLVWAVLAAIGFFAQVVMRQSKRTEESTEES